MKLSLCVCMFRQLISHFVGMELSGGVEAFILAALASYLNLIKA